MQQETSTPVKTKSMLKEPMNSVRIGLSSKASAVYLLYCATIYYLNNVQRYQCVTQPSLIHLSLKRFTVVQVNMKFEEKNKFFHTN